MKTQFQRNSVAKCSRKIDLGSGAKAQFALSDLRASPDGDPDGKIEVAFVTFPLPREENGE